MIVRSTLPPSIRGTCPKLAAKAVRRFRLHVVLFTVVCVVVTAGGGAGLVAWAMKDRPQTSALGWTGAQTAILNDFVGICQTPTYVFPELEVGLADAVRVEGGGFALHLLVRGRVAEERETGDGSSFRETTSVVATGRPGAELAQANVQPGATWGEVYVAVPAGGSQIDLLIQGPALDRPQTFTVDTKALRLGC